MDSWFPTFRRWLNREIPLPLWWPRRATVGQCHSLLRLIAIASEDNLPLAPLIENWAEDERGIQRSRLRKLASLLKSGSTLPDAVEQIPGILRENDVLAIRFDAQMGTRATSIRRMLNRSSDGETYYVQRVRGDLFYAATVLFVGLVIVGFLQLRIIPVFQKILEEYSQQPPTAMKWSIELARLFLGYWWVAAVGLFVLLWCIISTETGRFVRQSVFGSLLKPLRDLYAADVLEKLSIAAAAGRPIPGALSTLARYHYVPSVRQKLLFVRNETELGTNAWQSLNEVGMLSPPELRLLTTADRVGNRPWVLGQLATSKIERTRRQLQRTSEFLLPALVLLLGGFVLLQALMIFTPLVKFIEGRL
jgi:type II secretory pathway component PulF